MLQFDPNNQKPPFTPEWATYIPGRRRGGHFKVHKQVNHAKSALLMHGQGILYHFEDGEWKEEFRMDGFRKPDTCDGCGESLVTTYDSYPKRRYHRGHTQFIKGKFELQTRCWECISNRRSLTT